MVSEASAAAMAYLTPAQLAARYNVSKRTVTHWAQLGTITPAFRAGNIIRFNVEDTDRQLGIIKPEAAASKRGEA